MIPQIIFVSKYVDTTTHTFMMSFMGLIFANDATSTSVCVKMEGLPFLTRRIIIDSRELNRSIRPKKPDPPEISHGCLKMAIMVDLPVKVGIFHSN